MRPGPGPSLPRLVVVTDRRLVPPGRDLEQTLLACAAGGAEAVLVRELDLAPQVRAALVARLAAGSLQVLSARRWVPGAVGVHLTRAQTGLDARPAPWHGRSCHDDGEVRRAVGGGAAYLTVSPVATTPSKPGYGPALGPAGVGRAVRLAGDVPVLALGGVTPQNAAAFRDAGAHGVAVMGALMTAADPERVTRRLLEAVVW